jgi:hypothetical protein
MPFTLKALPLKGRGAGSNPLRAPGLPPNSKLHHAVEAFVGSAHKLGFDHRVPLEAVAERRIRSIAIARRLTRAQTGSVLQAS